MPALSHAAYEVLAASKISGHTVILPPDQLERSLYEEVNEVLVRLGGKWKKGKGHVFNFDPTALLDAVVKTGEMPPKNPTAFFPTPAELVDKLMGWIEWEWLPTDARILEPSAGAGAFLDAIMAKRAELGAEWVVECCEVLPINRTQLETKGYTVTGGDFMTFEPSEPYDVVLMNPPFSLEGDKLAYITHVERAFSMLRTGGQLVAITATGFQYRQDARSQAFYDMVCTYGECSENGSGAFKDSGTGVNTANVFMQKEDQSWRSRPWNGWPSWHAWAAWLWMENEQEHYEALWKLAKNPPADLATPVRDLFEKVAKWARKNGDAVKLTSSDHTYLLKHFEADMRAEGLAPIVPAPTTTSDHGLGGLFAFDEAA